MATIYECIFGEAPCRSHTLTWVSSRAMGPSIHRLMMNAFTNKKKWLLLQNINTETKRINEWELKVALNISLLKNARLAVVLCMDSVHWAPADHRCQPETQTSNKTLKSFVMHSFCLLITRNRSRIYIVMLISVFRHLRDSVSFHRMTV